MRMRTLKPDLPRTADFGDLPREPQCTFALMMMYLDDDGRGIDDLVLIKADCYPRSPVTLDDIEHDLQALTTTPEPLVCRYSVNGKRYLHVPRFRDESGDPVAWSQRPNRYYASKYPPCPNEHKTDGQDELFAASEVHDTRTAGAAQSQCAASPVEVEVEVDSRSRSSARKARALPDDWEPGDKGLSYAAQHAPLINVPREVEKFRSYHLSKGSLFKAWDQAWRTWVNNAQEYAERDGHRPPLRVVDDRESASPWQPHGARR